MSWTYRVIRIADDLLAMHEVYSTADGAPHSWSEEPCDVTASDIEGLSWQLDEMKKALEKPVLKVKDGKLMESTS